MEELLQQRALSSCGPRLVFVQQSPPSHSTLSVAFVLQQLLRTLLTHHDQHVAELRTEGSRVRIHVDVPHRSDVPGLAQNQQVLEATVDGSAVSHELELERPPARFTTLECHRLTQQPRVHDCRCTSSCGLRRRGSSLSLLCSCR